MVNLAALALAALSLAAPPAAAQNGVTQTMFMCDASGNSAQADVPFNLYVGDVVHVRSQSAPLYKSSSKCYLTFHAASGTGCGINVKAFSYQLENVSCRVRLPCACACACASACACVRRVRVPRAHLQGGAGDRRAHALSQPFDFLRTYNYTAPPTAVHLETNFFPWNSFVPALTGSYNYPPIAGAPPAYSLDLAADGASWVSLVFTSDANGNFAGVESVVVSATACVAGATSTRTATSSAAPSSMPSSSAAPSPTLSTLPTPRGTTASLVMCGAGGATTAGVASPYDLYFGDVVRVSSQSASTYASPSNCVLTFRGAPGTGCGLNLKIFAYQLEDEIDFLDAYNYSAPPQGVPLVTLFFPWNEYIPRITGSYNLGGTLTAANYSLDVPAGDSWLSLVFTADASNTGAGLKSAVVSATQCGPGATSTRTGLASVSATPSPSPRAQVMMCSGTGFSQLWGAPIVMSPGTSLALSSQAAATMFPQQVCLLTVKSSSSTCGIAFTPSLLDFSSNTTTFDLLSSVAGASPIGGFLGFQTLSGATRCTGPTIATVLAVGVGGCESLCFATSGCLTYSYCIPGIPGCIAQYVISARGLYESQCTLFSFSAGSSSIGPGTCSFQSGWTSAYLQAAPSSAPPNPDSPFADALVLAGGAYAVGVPVEVPPAQALMMYLRTIDGTDGGAGIAGILTTTGPYPCSLTWLPTPSVLASASPAAQAGVAVAGAKPGGLDPGAVAAIVIVMLVAAAVGGAYADFLRRRRLEAERGRMREAADAAAADAAKKSESAASAPQDYTNIYTNSEALTTRVPRAHASTGTSTRMRARARARACRTLTVNRAARLPEQQSRPRQSRALACPATTPPLCGCSTSSSSRRSSTRAARRASLCARP
jgi:hypothetical protein